MIRRVITERKVVVTETTTQEFIDDTPETVVQDQPLSAGSVSIVPTIDIVALAPTYAFNRNLAVRGYRK